MLVSEPFVPMAEAHAMRLDYPGARLVTFAHPLSGIDEAAVRGRAEAVADLVVERFLSAPR